MITAEALTKRVTGVGSDGPVACSCVMTTATPHWTDVGAHEILPGVFRIPLPLPEGPPAINVYAIVDGDGVVLIDSGWANDDSAGHLDRALEQIGFGTDRISQILVTHWHTDHYSQALSIRRRHGTPVSLGVGERETVEWHATNPENGCEPISSTAMLARAGASDLARELGAMIEGVAAVGVEAPDRWF